MSGMVEGQGRLETTAAGSRLEQAGIMLPALLLVGLFLTPAELLPGSLAGLLAAVLLLVYPGWLLLRLLAPGWRPGRATWPLAAALGYGLWALPAVALILLQGPLDALLYLAAVGTGVLALLAAWRAGAQPAPPKNGRTIWAGLRARLRRDWWAELLFWGAVAAALWLFFHSAAVERFSDRQTYLAQIRYYFDAPTLGTQGYLPYQEIGVRTQLAAWLVEVAGIARLGKVDPGLLYSFVLPPLLIVCSLLAAWGLGRAVTGSRRGGALGGALLVLQWASTMALPSTAAYSWLERVQLRPEGAFATLGYWATSSHIMEDKFVLIFVLLPAAQLLLLRFWGRGGRGLLGLLAVAMAGLSFVHPLGAAFFGLSFAALALVSLLRPARCSGGRRTLLLRAAAVGVLLLAAMAAPFLQRETLLDIRGPALAAPGAAEDFVNFGPAGVGLWVWPAHPELYAVDLFVLWRQPLVLLALLLLPLVALWGRLRRAGDQWLLGMLAFGLLVTYNPLIAPLLGRIITYRMLFRTVWLMELPAMLLLARAALLGWSLWRRRQARAARSGVAAFPRPAWLRLGAVLGALLLLAGALALLAPGIAAGLDLLNGVQAAALTADEAAALDYLRSEAQPGSIAWAPPDLIDELPPATGRVAGPYFRYTSLDPAYFALIRDFYAPDTVDAGRLALLAEHQPGYVLAKSGSGIDRQLGELPAAFTIFYRNPGVVVYQLLPGAAQSEPLASILAARAAQQAGDPMGAAAALDQVLAAWPENASALALLAQVQLALGDVDAAQEAAQAAVALAPQASWAPGLLAQVARGRAELAAQRGDMRGAAAGYAAALAANGKDVVSAAHLAQHLAGAEDPVQAAADALAALEAATAVVPDRTTAERSAAFSQWGAALEATGDQAGAQQAYAAAIAVARPWDALARASAMAQLGRFWVRTGQVEKAAQLYADGVKRYPGAAALYDAWAELAALKEGAAGSELVYTAGAAANPQAMWPQVRLAQVAWQARRDAAGALALLEPALAQAGAAGDSQQAAYALAAQIRAAEEGDAAAAQAVWAEAAAAHPEASWAWLGLAQAAQAAGDQEATAAALAQAAALVPGDLALAAQLAQAQAALAQTQAAQRYWDAAADRPPGEFVAVNAPLSAADSGDAGAGMAGWTLVGYGGNQPVLVRGVATPLWLFWAAPPTAGEDAAAGPAAAGWESIGPRLWVQRVAEAKNLVGDGSFTRSAAVGRMLGFGEDIYGAEAQTRQVALVRGGPRSGVAAVLQNDTANLNSSLVTPPLPVDAEKLYLQAGAMRSSESRGSLGLWWRLGDGSAAQEQYAVDGDTGGVWQQGAQLLAPPAGAEALQVLLLNRGGGRAEFDDLLLLALDAPGE